MLFGAAADSLEKAVDKVRSVGGGSQVSREASACVGGGGVLGARGEVGAVAPMLAPTVCQEPEMTQHSADRRWQGV